jgi:hypothetical protein
MTKAQLAAEFCKTIALPIGVTFGGAEYRDCTVGPETIDAVERACLALAPEIDVTLGLQAYWHDADDAWKKNWHAAEDGKVPDKPTLTPRDLSLGRRYWQIYRQKSALARVTKIGAIPETEVVNVALALPMEDVTVIAAAAAEVDAAVAKSRKENAAAAARTAAPVGDAFV